MGNVFLQLLTAEVEQNEAKYVFVYIPKVNP